MGAVLASRPPDTRPSPFSVALSAALLGPAALGLALGWLGERTAVSALLLLGEPALWALGLYGIGALLLHRQRALAVALALGCATGAAALRFPTVPTPPEAVEAGWPAELQRCASALPGARAPIRLLTWTVPANAPVDAAALLAEEPDLVVLLGAEDQDLAEALEDGLEGEAHIFPGQRGGDGAILAVRGTFQYCGGNIDAWSLPLPDSGGPVARLLLTFPEVRDAGVLPLLAARADGAGGRWLDWPARAQESRRRLAATAVAIGAEHMVLAGDLAAPASFRLLRGALEGAGLRRVPAPPTWPARLGPLPTPTLHTLDQVWAGRGWRALGAEALRDGEGPRARLLVDLAPASPIPTGPTLSSPDSL